MVDDDELARLRAQVAALRTELDQRDSSPAQLPRWTGSGSKRWRLTFAGLFIALGAILAPTSVVATWAHDVIGDTERYMETVAPLASDPAVKRAVTDRVTEVIVESLSVDDLTANTLDALARQDFVPPKAAPLLTGLQSPINNAFHSFVHGTVQNVVDSENFERVWLAANREAHEQAVAILTNQKGEHVDVTDGEVSINIAGFVEAAKSRLIDRGFELAERIPAVNASFVMFHSTSLEKAQTAFSLLDTGARILPLLALLALVGGILLAPGRRAALLGAGIAVGTSMLALSLVLNVTRPFYLEAVPDEVLPNDAAAAIYDQFTQFLTTSLRAIVILALVITITAYLLADHGTGKTIRSGLVRAVRRVHDRFSIFRGPISAFVTRNRTFVRTAVIAVGVHIYILLPYPSGASALVIVIVVVIGVAIAELFVNRRNTPPHANT